MAHEEVVHLGVVAGNLAERGAKQVVPEPALDLDGLVVGGLSVQPFERVDVALVGGADGSQVLFDLCAV